MLKPLHWQLQFMEWINAIHLQQPLPYSYFKLITHWQTMKKKKRVVHNSKKNVNNTQIGV